MRYNNNWTMQYQHHLVWHMMCYAPSTNLLALTNPPPTCFYLFCSTPQEEQLALSEPMRSSSPPPLSAMSVQIILCSPTLHSPALVRKSMPIMTFLRRDEELEHLVQRVARRRLDMDEKTLLMSRVAILPDCYNYGTAVTYIDKVRDVFHHITTCPSMERLLCAGN